MSNLNLLSLLITINILGFLITIHIFIRKHSVSIFLFSTLAAFLSLIVYPGSYPLVLNIYKKITLTFS